MLLFQIIAIILKPQILLIYLCTLCAIKISADYLSDMLSIWYIIIGEVRSRYKYNIHNMSPKVIYWQSKSHDLPNCTLDDELRK